MKMLEQVHTYALGHRLFGERQQQQPRLVAGGLADPVNAYRARLPPQQCLFTFLDNRPKRKAAPPALTPEQPMLENA